MPRRIIDPTRIFTFSDYFRLNYSTEDVLEELNCYFRKEKITLPRSEYPVDKQQQLREVIENNLEQTSLINEETRKQAIIAPILFEICKYTKLKLNIEYPIKVSEQLKGVIDYAIKKDDTFIVVEAKQVDMVRGFTQLAVELIALDQWIESDKQILYGAVTTGDIWKFGTYDRQGKAITEDSKVILIPDDLQHLMDILLGILS